MNATELLAELRPPLEDATPDDATLERILLAPPEPPRPRSRGRARRPLLVAAAVGVLATAGFALMPSAGRTPGGLERAVAALSDPEVLLHFKATTTHLPNGATESTETWQTPDGRRARTVRRDGSEIVYDQSRRIRHTVRPRARGDRRGHRPPALRRTA